MDRKHDLNYLQWLQQNAQFYLTGMTILTFFIVLTFCVCFFQPWQPEKSIALWHEDDSDQAVAEQQKPERQTDIDAQQTEQRQVQQPAAVAQPTQQEQTQQPNQAKDTPAPEQAPTAQTAEPEESEKLIQADTVDPLILETQFAAFAEPCQGELLYGYGVGYDSLYDDYRFHDMLCYQADQGVVLAAVGGIVQRVQLEEPWQLLIQCGDYELRYRGLTSCDAAVGDTVTAGQAVGTAGALLYVQAVKQR